MHARWLRYFCTSLTFIFGLLPSLLVSFFALRVALFLVPTLFSDRVFFAILSISLNCMIVYGTYTLIVHLLGTPVHKIFGGLFAGALGLLSYVIAPFVVMTLAHFDYYEPRFNSGWDNYGMSIIFASISTPPALVLSTLALLGWWRKRNS